MDEYDWDRDKQNCPYCGGMWSEDNMTALKYAELSESEKDQYDEQLIKLIKNSPKFDEDTYTYLNGDSLKDGGFWAHFRVDKWRKLDLSDPIEQIDETIEDRKNREPFKPFPPIDEVKAREVALEAELEHEAIKYGYYSNKNNNLQSNIPRCPKCGSTNIQIVPRKWSLLTGFLTNKTDRVCVNCKHKF